MTYDKILEKIQSKNEEGSSLRTKFIWVKQRFELEFGEEKEWKKYLEKYFVENFRGDFDGTLSEELLSDDKVFKFISSKWDETLEKKVNNYWKEHNEKFITVLSNYRDIGSVDQNQTGQLMNFAKNINNDPLRYIYEIIQNADDCEYDEKPTIEINIEENKINVSYNERGMLYSDIIALTTIGQSNKKNRIKRRLIGEKGIGFKTIFSAVDTVDIHSGGYHFELTDNSFAPKYIGGKTSKEISKIKTNLELCFLQDKNVETRKDGKLKLNPQKLYLDLMKKYGVCKSSGIDKENETFNKQEAFKNCPILFTNRLKKIIVSYNGEKFSIERTDKDNNNIRLIYKYNDELLAEISCFKLEENIKFTYKEYCSRYPKEFSDESEYNSLKDKDVITYPAIIIAPKDCSEIKEGNLYSYLPTYTNIKAPFNIQLPIKLNLDRSCMYFDGEQDTTAQVQNSDEEISTILWNERLLNEIFFNDESLIKSFYEKIKKENMNVFEYIPNFEINNHHLFKTTEKFSDSIKKLNDYCSSKKLFNIFKDIKYFKKYSTDEYCTADKAIMFDEFIMNKFSESYFNKLSGSDNKEKFLVEFNQSAIEKTKVFGFKQYIVNDEDKTTYLNNVLSNNESYVIEECKKENGRSIYLPENIKNLNIFPVNESKRYTCLSGKYWFKNAKCSSYDKICFLSGEIAMKGLFATDEIQRCFTDCSNEVISEIVWDTIWEKMYNKTGNTETYQCDRELFIELMTFIPKNTENNTIEDWYYYTKSILESKGNNGYKFWNETRKQNLIDLLNDKVGEYINE